MEMIQLMERYWLENERLLFTHTQTRLFLFLVHWCIKHDLGEEFELPSSRIAAETGMTSHTAKAAALALAERGLIRFTPATPKSRARYAIVLGVQCSRTAQPCEAPASEAPEVIESEPVIPTPPAERLIRKNEEEIDLDDYIPWGDMPGTEPFVIPSLAMVEEIFSYYSHRMPDYRKEARQFFYHFEQEEWRLDDGLILDWRFVAHKWINHYFPTAQFSLKEIQGL